MTRAVFFYHSNGPLTKYALHTYFVSAQLSNVGMAFLSKNRCFGAALSVSSYCALFRQHDVSQNSGSVWQDQQACFHLFELVTVTV